MLANDQIRSVAQQITRTADARVHTADEDYQRQQLWEIVRHACHAIEAVTDMEHDALDGAARVKRARYLVAELESALEAAKKAKVMVDWSRRSGDDDF